MYTHVPHQLLPRVIGGKLWAFDRGLSQLYLLKHIRFFAVTSWRGIILTGTMYVLWRYRHRNKILYGTGCVTDGMFGYFYFF